LHHAAALTEESMIASCSLKDCAASRQLSGMSRVFLQTGHSPQRPDSLAGAAGFEPLHLLRIRAGGFEPLLFRIGIRQVARFEPLHLGIRSAALAVAQSAHLTSFVGHPRLLPTRYAPDHFSNGDAEVRILPPQPRSRDSVNPGRFGCHSRAKKAPRERGLGLRDPTVQR
jgi:hypothetical protein